MANILEPIHALPDLTKPTSAPPPRLEADTVELPALRPAPLPLELLAARAPAPPERSRAATRVAPLVALGILVAISSAAAVALAALREDREPPPPVEPIVAGLTLPAEPLALEPAAEDAAVAPEVAPADPRALARRARLHLRAGRHRAALDGAREAAALRPRSPYYQTLLGDAYAAHGRDVEARRAWRRALGLRAGYAPARARLAGET